MFRIHYCCVLTHKLFFLPFFLQLEKDQKNCNPKTDPKCMPKMSADEALCKYGQSGNARGEACKRFRASGGALPTSTKTKSLGGAYAM